MEEPNPWHTWLAVLGDDQLRLFILRFLNFVLQVFGVFLAVILHSALR